MSSPTLQVVPASTSVQQGDPVLVRVGLVNDTISTIVVPALAQRLSYAYEARLTDGTALVVGRCWRRELAGVVDAVELAPGKGVFVLDSLAAVLPVWESASVDLRVVVSLGDGVALIGTDGVQVPEGEFWNGTLESPWVTVHVAPGDGPTLAAIQELPTTASGPLCLEPTDREVLTQFVSEHQATPLGAYVELTLAYWTDTEAVDAWTVAHEGSHLSGLAAHLAFSAALRSRSGRVARERLNGTLLSDPFFGPLATQFEPRVAELEAVDAAFDAAWDDE